MKLYAGIADDPDNDYSDFQVRAMDVEKDGEGYSILNSRKFSDDFFMEEGQYDYIDECDLEDWTPNKTLGGEVYYSLDKDTCIAAVNTRRQMAIKEAEDLLNYLKDNAVVVYADEEDEE